MLQFDTNVVPSADYIRDYEELWTEQARQSPTFRRIINSSTSQKGYYIESINNNVATEEEKTSVDYIIP